MKIECTTPKRDLFVDIKRGEAFWANGILYMKIDALTGPQDSVFNCIRLSNGAAGYCTSSTEVTPAPTASVTL